ncbi:ABC transporter substrate-binding protein [Nocardioides campestrisoli]|uniref:ABC transporter substrate-binding protein n=1 Tax=Nocardioides campestrisoli TaxID=2736757 RepID=UPI0015E70F55|nr:ABC transporter substrate-binding protein [Nocardioides campestrisoli]
MTAQRTRSPRRLLASAAVLSLVVLAGACAGDDLSSDEAGNDDGGGSQGSVTLASQNFGEAALVTAMYAEVLEDAGYNVTTKLVGSRAVYMEEFPGEVDVVPEYVAGISDYLNTSADGADAEPITTNDAAESIDAAQPLLDDAGITLLEPSEATSQNAYFVTTERAEAEELTALSDLEGEKVVLAAAPDCEGRDDCEKGLAETYGIDVTELLPLGFGSPQTYQAVIDGEADLGQSGTLDGTLESQGLVLLEDDRGIQPAQNLVPAVSSEFLDANPDVQDRLEGLMGALDNETLGDLIARVTVDREKPEDVASEWLQEQGLVS